MELRISRLFQLSIVAVGIFAIFAFFSAAASHPYFDVTSILLISTIGALLYGFSGKFTTRYPFVLIVTFTLFVFTYLRLAMLIVIPTSLLHWHATTPELINRALFFMAMGIVACYFGLALGIGRRWFRNTEHRTIESHGGDRALKILFGLLILSVLSGALQYYQIGYLGTSSDKSNVNFFSRYLSVLVDPNSLSLLFFLVWTVRPSTRSNNRLLLLVLGTTFAGSVLLGSRGTTMFVLLLWLAAKLVVDGDFFVKLSIRNFLIAVFGVFLLGFLFFFAMVFRMLRYTSGIDFANAFLIVSDASGLGDAIQIIVSDISYRLSSIESVNFVISWREFGLRDVSDIINIQSTVLNSIERILPGKQFGETIFSEFAYGFMFSPEGVIAIADDGRLDLTGYEWNMFGLSYQLFGGLGGIVFIFLFAALFGWVIRYFWARGGLYGYAYAAFFAWSLNAWVQNLGGDNFVGRTAIGFVSLTVTIALLRLLVPRLRVQGFRTRVA